MCSFNFARFETLNLDYNNKLNKYKKLIKNKQYLSFSGIKSP